VKRRDALALTLGQGATCLNRGRVSLCLRTKNRRIRRQPRGLRLSRPKEVASVIESAARALSK
jgi:hypothetical protein